MDQITRFFDPVTIGNMVVGFIPMLFSALLVFFAFWVTVKLTRPPLRGVLRGAELEEALIDLLVDQIYTYAMWVLGMVMAASQLGIDVAAALAGIGVAGIAIGFAAQDALANVISGFLIFLDKPFLVGHFVTTQDKYGEITEITMRTTRIRTRNNTYVVIPNKQIIDDVLVNHTLYGETRIDVPVGIAYKENIPEAREVLLAAAANVDGILEDPAPEVVATGLGDSSVDLELRVWIADPSKERPVFSRTLEAAKLALDDADIEIPFPHLQLFVDDVEERVWEGAVRHLPAAS